MMQTCSVLYHPPHPMMQTCSVLYHLPHPMMQTCSVLYHPPYPMMQTCGVLYHPPYPMMQTCGVLYHIPYPLMQTWAELVPVLLFEGCVYCAVISCFIHDLPCGALWPVAHQAPLSMGFSRHEYWSGLPRSPSRDLPNPGIEPGSPVLQADSFPSEPPGKPSLQEHLGLNECL